MKLIWFDKEKEGSVSTEAKYINTIMKLISANAKKSYRLLVFHQTLKRFQTQKRTHAALRKGSQ